MSGSKRKLHLGCGENYLQGYHNIDFPSTSHTVQTNTVVDEYADILELYYSVSSMAEVRLHHVFKHFFTRPASLALLASWWSSRLAKDGILRIEVPGFDRCARIVLSPFSISTNQNRTERHLFSVFSIIILSHIEKIFQITQTGIAKWRT